MFNFFIEWGIYFIMILWCMCIDNCFWVSASPEYKEFKKLPLFKKGTYWLNMEGKTYKNKVSYIFGYRIFTVITHWRDIIPAIITSFLLTLTINYIF